MEMSGADFAREPEAAYINPLAVHLGRIAGLWDLKVNNTCSGFGGEVGGAIEQPDDLRSVLGRTNIFRGLRDTLGPEVFETATTDAYRQITEAGGPTAFMEQWTAEQHKAPEPKRTSRFLRFFPSHKAPKSS